MRMDLTEIIGKPLAWLVDHSREQRFDNGRVEYNFKGHLPYNMVAKIRKDLKAKNFEYVPCGSTASALRGYCDKDQLVSVFFENGSFRSTECNIRFSLTDYRLCRLNEQKRRIWAAVLREIGPLFSDEDIESVWAAIQDTGLDLDRVLTMEDVAAFALKEPHAYDSGISDGQ